MTTPTPKTPPTSAATVVCPKCGRGARDVARFCQRCHMTLRYECPACRHEQRQGGTCEKCGADFVKCLAAMISAKRVERDTDRERFEQRSSLLHPAHAGHSDSPQLARWTQVAFRSAFAPPLIFLFSALQLFLCAALAAPSYGRNIPAPV